MLHITLVHLRYIENKSQVWKRKKGTLDHIDPWEHTDCHQPFHQVIFDLELYTPLTYDARLSLRTFHEARDHDSVFSQVCYKRRPDYPA